MQRSDKKPQKMKPVPELRKVDWPKKVFLVEDDEDEREDVHFLVLESPRDVERHMHDVSDDRVRVAVYKYVGEMTAEVKTTTKFTMR